MGGELLQTVTRDTMKFAMKASAIKIGESDSWRDVFKEPITDPGKTSKKGRLAVVLRDGHIATIQEHELAFDEHNLLEEVYVDGKIIREQTFADIRNRAASA